MSALATKVFTQNTKNVLLVDAYLRQLQKLLICNKNEQTKVAIDIRNICLLFYKFSTYIDFESAGNKEIYDNCISTDNDIITFHNTITTRRSHVVTCLIGKEINANMCKKIKVNFKSLIDSDKIIDYLDSIYIGFRDTQYEIPSFKAFACKFETHSLATSSKQAGVVGINIEYNKKNRFIVWWDLGRDQGRQKFSSKIYIG